jgi:hypothetical protein
MSKMIRLEDDVYPALKGYASREGKTLSAAVYALMHTANGSNLIEKRFSSLESQIAELKELLITNKTLEIPQSPLALQSTHQRWARPDSNRRPPPCEGDVITA